MNRMLLAVAGVLSASSLLMVDAAVKGTALLALATVAALILRRDSAATRHLVWLLAMGATLAVPVLSSVLPGWCVLPEWATISRESVAVRAISTSTANPASVPTESPISAEPVEVERTVAAPEPSAAGSTDVRPAVVTPGSNHEWAVWSWNGLNPLPLIWAVGCCLHILRLVAARWMLWNTERQATLSGSSIRKTTGTDATLVTALESACSQLGISRPVSLLSHPDKSIPVVWGIVRHRLLLPEASRRWSGEQLRSVLLHELAHVKRGDALAQLLAQVACAVHWFNPLVWFAAWRLSVERERACDDLVLASGVRPSAYAGHLLEVVTGLSPSRWTRTCGLAMARKSSLEGRLVAVLSQYPNRRALSVALAAIALAVTVGFAVPIAMLRAADERPATAARPDPQKPKESAMLNPTTEQKLDWGEPVNGLRLALAWPPVLGEPAAGDVADFYVAVQNTSQAPVRLCTTAGSPDERWLDLKDKDGILFRLSSKEPTDADVTLKPREAVFLRLFPEAATQPDTIPAGAGIASSVRQSPDYRMKATLKVDKAPVGAWSGTLVTPDTRAGVGAESPKNRKARELFKVWQSRARLSGKIPGGFISRMGEHVKVFVKSNATAGSPYAKRMEPLLSRLDGTRDWQPEEASSLLRDIAAVSEAPLIVMLEEIARGRVQHGLPFNSDLENAPWGEPVGHGIGLRTASLIGPGIESKLQYVDWIGNVVTEGRSASDSTGVVESRAAFRLGTPLGCRILIRNTSEAPVIFRTRTWHHIEPTATDAKGSEIGIESLTRFTRAPLVTFRLEPGRYIELASPGFGLGRYGYHNFKHADIATWIGANAGDDVTLTPGVLPLHDWNEVEVRDGEPRWWLDFITARLNLVAPVPADPAERRELLNKAMADLFRQDVHPTEAETAAFQRDTSPEALRNLAMRLHERTGLRSWAGPLQSGPTRFRVLPADPTNPKPAKSPAAAQPPTTPAPADNPPATPTSDKPKGKEAQSLFKTWQDRARTNGMIPGGALGSLARVAANFVKLNPGDERAPKIAEWLKRIDTSHDWTPADAVALLDDVTAIYAPLPEWAENEPRFTLGGAVQTGRPLPSELENAPWGVAHSNGLRVAWLLEPRSEQYRLGTPLKSRILFHNAGTGTVMFRALTWNQSAAHKARDANGKHINTFSAEWTTIPRIVACRLGSGEFLEVTAAGIGIGAKENDEDWRNTRVGTWVEAKAGDEVSFTPAPISATGNFTDPRSKGEPAWWLDFIKDRLRVDSPVPADAAERTRLLDRAVRDLFGTAPTPEETAAFVADHAPDAFDALAKRLAERAGTSSFTGTLQSGDTNFRTLPVDPNAAK
jgi:beta-lactamase regulating signal transducer with metallopeptidase domain